MKVAIIAPIPHLEYTRLGTMHMALAHLILKSPEYFRFYEQETMFKILDNGTFEGEPIPFEQVLDIAQSIWADEIVLPDIIYNCQGTLHLVDYTIAMLIKKKLHHKYKWMAVVQGKTEEEWWDCFHYLNRNPYVNTIGINKLSTPLAFGGTTTVARLYVTKLIEDRGYIKPNKEYHLLGGSYQMMQEVERHPSWIRSIDSSAPVIYGSKGILLAHAQKAVKGPVDFNKVIPKAYESHIIQNIQDVVKGG